MPIPEIHGWKNVSDRMLRRLAFARATGAPCEHRGIALCQTMETANFSEKMEPTEADADTVDVVVLGGALSGAAAAYLLKKMRPGLSVRVIERSEVFSRRVGEATVEISSYFLTRVLGLTEYLNQEHLNKQGLRFWFHKPGSEDADACSEVGPGYNVRIPSFQVDRAKMDEEVLRRAVEAGAELVRPAEVKAVDLMRGGLSTVTYVADGQTTTLHEGWRTWFRVPADVHPQPSPEPKIAANPL